jgi:tRNA/rRNA methyltransferase
MPGAGTDKTRHWTVAPGPVVVLVEPQLGENIGAAARAMANFGLSELRLVKPVAGWPNPKAAMMAAGADRVLDAATLHDSLQAAIADCSFVAAATARGHDQVKPVAGADEVAGIMASRVAAGERVAIVFGRERNGLENHEVGLADVILTLPVNPAFASLNLAQAVAIVAYEWFKQTGSGLPFAQPDKSPPAPKEQLLSFFETLEAELENIEYFRPSEKRGTMVVNLRNIFNRMKPTQQDIRTLHGVIMAIAEGRKGPARGGVLDGTQAAMLRALLAQDEVARTPDLPRTTHGPMRGLARLLRRNPTDAERVMWHALTTDKRFTHAGFKRQTPVGRHIVDFVSFPLRIAIEIVPPENTSEQVKARTARQGWLLERRYSVYSVRAADVERDVKGILDAVARDSGL